MIRKNKLYVRPKKAYEKTRIEEENKLVEKYGLKNKREVWRTIAKVSYYRRRAKDLAKSSLEEQNVLFDKLKDRGLNTNSIADVLALKIEDLLARTLTTVVYRKGLAKTPKQARQMIVHKKVMINDKVMNSPNYIVSVSEENAITLRINKPKVVVKKEEVQEKAEEVAA